MMGWGIVLPSMPFKVTGTASAMRTPFVFTPGSSVELDVAPLAFLRELEGPGHRGLEPGRRTQTSVAHPGRLTLHTIDAG